MLNTFLHEHDKLNAKLAFEVVQHVGCAIAFVHVSLFTVFELLAAFTAWLRGALDFLFSLTSVFVGTAFTTMFPHFLA